MLLKRHLTAGIAALLAFGAYPAHAEELVLAGTTIQAVGTQTGIYSTNPLLLVNGEKELSGSVTSPEIIIRDVRPNQEIKFDTRVDANIFNQAGYNSTDVHSSFDYKRENERWSFSAPQRFDFDTTRTGK